MKKLLFIIMLLPVFAIGQPSIGQFNKELKEADSLWISKGYDELIGKTLKNTNEVFEEQAKEAAVDAAFETDSIFSTRSFYNCVVECEFGTNKLVTITHNDYLNEYMNGYMMGQLSFYYYKDFNFELLERKLKKIKKELQKIK